MTPGKRSHTDRLLGVIGAALAVHVFVLAVVFGVLLHINVPATRRLVASQVSAVLDRTLAGKILVERIGALGLTRIDGLRVRVSDPDGVVVLRLDDVRLRLDLVELARSALFGHGPIVIRVPSASIGNVDANLDADEEGRLRLVDAVSPERSEPPRAEGARAPPGRGVRLEAPDLSLAHASVHGKPAAKTPRVDVDLWNLVAHGHVDPSGVRAELEHVRFVSRAMPRRLDPSGTIAGSFRHPAESGQGIELEARFDGDIGGIPTVVQARMNGDEIDARIDARDLTGATARALVNEVAIREPVALHAEARGVLPHVETKAELTLGRATIDAIAVVDAGEPTRVNGTVAARHIDVAAIVRGAPSSDLGLDGRVKLSIRQGDLEGDASIDTLPGALGRDRVPVVEVRGQFSSRTAQLRARIHERTMPTQVSIDLGPREDGVEGEAIRATLRTNILDLRRVPKLGAVARGSAEITARGRVVLPEKRFDAAIDVSGTDVSSSALGAREVHAHVRADGTIDRPVIDAEVHATDLSSGKEVISTADARARIEVAKTAVTLRELHVDAMRDGGTPLAARASFVRIGGGTAVRVEGVEVTGLGAPIRGEFSMSPREISGTIDAPRIDLSLVARLTRRADLRRGILAVRGGAVLRDGDTSAELHAALSDLELGLVHDASAAVDATMHGRDIALDVRAHLDDSGTLALRANDVVIGGRAADPLSWRRAYGQVHLDGRLDMEKVASLLPPGMLPVADLRGTITVQGRLGRDREDAPPEVHLHAQTNGLLVAAPSKPEPPIDGITVEHAPKWRSTDLDLGLDVQNDGTSGLTDVAFRARDRFGSLLALDLKAIIPYAELAGDRSLTKELLLSAPLSAKLVVPTRRLDQLPAVLASNGLQGAMEAELDASGTVLEPKVRLVARSRDLHTPAMPLGLKTDSDVLLAYDGIGADLAVKMRAKGRQLLDLTSRIEASVRDVVLGPSGRPVAWNARGNVRFASFPLETFPQLVDRQVKGNVSGEVSFGGIHEDARVKGMIDLDGLTVGAARYPVGRISIDAGGGALTAKARLEQTDGFLDATARAGLTWGARLAPTVAFDQPLQAKLVARGFRAAAIQPFVQSIVPSIDGRIDADASAVLSPGQEKPTLEGKVTIRDGTVQIVALGESLRRVTASAVMSPDGTIKIDDVFARGTQGELRADANVKLDGIRLASATANIRIPESAPLDLAPNGHPIGQLAGNIKVRASSRPDENATELVVEAPRLSVVLPQVTKRGLQRLGVKENIRVGTFRDPRTFVELPLEREDLLPRKHEEQREHIDVDVRLGRVEVARGNQARIVLTGNPKVSFDDDGPKLTGQISAVSGWLDVQGKKFEIERGTVTFEGATPPNPIVVATAGWTAADGTRVYADFVGPLETGRLVLRSEPARPKNEILALVLFGSADGVNPAPPAVGSQTDGTAKAAVSLGGGLAAQGLTEALDDLTGIQATARIDTTRASNPRPEVEFQLSPKVSIAFAHVLGTPPVAAPDKNFAMMEYRFHKNWSLETTVGDRGRAMVDAIWQKRY